MVAFSFAPKGWAACNGQTMPINQNQALFSLLGTTFGGDGRTNFLLPDFRGRAPIEPGTLGNATYNWGQNGGEELHTLVQTEMAAHTHTATASSASNTLGSPSGNFWATGPTQYASSPINTALAANAIANSGSNQGHENRSPYLVINFIIALTGIFPSRN
jgi:microcystin-dependent protein